MNYQLFSKIDEKGLVLVTVSLNKKETKTKLVIKNNVFSFEISNDIDYFYFLIGKTKSDHVYPSGITNKYELSFNEKINSYVISLYPEYEEGIYEKFNLDPVGFLPKDIKNQKYWTYLPKNVDPKSKLGLIITFDGHAAFYHGKYKDTNIYHGTQIDIVADILSNKHKKNFLVLAIDNGNKYRSRELTMSPNFGKLHFNKIKNITKDFDQGILEDYMEFILNKLLPIIKSKYDIDESNIGILGQSSGGLASYYALVKYPSTFSFGLVLSPAFPFFSKKDLSSFYKKNIQLNLKHPKIYLYSGNITSLEKNICKSTINLYKELIKYDKENLSIRINYQGNHNEIPWRLAISEGIKKTLLED